MSSLSNGVAIRTGFGYEIYNGHDVDILVRNKGGYNQIVPAAKGIRYDRSVILCVNAVFPAEGELIFDIEGCGNSLDKEIMTNLQNEIQQRRSKQEIRGFAGPIEVEFKIELGNSFVQRTTGDIVSDILGIELSLRLGNKSKFISDSGNRLFQDISEDVFSLVSENQESEGIAWGASIVDSENALPRLWTPLLGEAKAIPVKRELSIPDGLYVVKREGSNPKEKIFVPLSELTGDRLVALGLYRNKDAARLGGNGKLLQELKSKVEQSTMMLNESTLKHNTSLEMIENFKRQLAAYKTEKTLADERNRLTLEAVKAKSSNSSFSEFIKGLVSVAGMVFTGIKLFS